MALREWAANTAYRQGDCVVIPNGSGGYFGDANGSKTWLLCCVGSGATPDNSPYGVSGAVKTQNEWATLFEGTGTDGNVSEATVMPATLSAGAGPDGNIRWALGVAYFLDTSAAVNGNGAYGTPYNTSDSISGTQISTQDGTNSVRHLYIKRGTTVRTDSVGGDWLGRGSSRRHYATISDYGTGAIPKIDASATTGGNAGILVYKASTNPARYCLIENVEVYGASGSGVSIFLGTGEASISQNDIIVRNVISHDNVESGIQALTGGDIDRSASSTNLTIEDCTAYNNGVYGIAAREWWDGIKIIRPTVFNNGLNAPNGAYGVSTIGNFRAHTVTGWSQLSASPNIWQRVFTRTNNVIAGRYRLLDDNERILTVGTFGALAADYQVANSAGTVQVRLGPGETPNSQAVWLCYNRVKNVQITDGSISTTNDFRAASGRFDGDGIGIDQFSENVVVTRNVVNGNGGCGIITNQPLNIWILGNSFANNGAQKSEASQTNAGILVNHPQGTAVVVHNTVTAQADDGIRVYTPNGVLPIVQNNMVRDCGGSGLYGTLTAVDGGMAETYNWLSGNATTATNVTPDATDSTASAAAYLNADGSIKWDGYSIASPNPVAVFGSYYQGVTCLNSRVRPGWVPAGAYVGKVEGPQRV